MPRMPYARRVAVACIVAGALAACSSQSSREPTAPPSRSTQQPATNQTLPATPGVLYDVGQRATSNIDAFSQIILELRTARETDSELELQVAFVNTSNQSFRLTNSPSGNDMVLRDASGREYTPQQIDTSLQQIDPPEGFSPGAANIGFLRFPLPRQDGPYQLLFPNYTPIAFSLETPFVARAQPPNGDFPLGVSLHSQSDVLQPIELHLDTMTISDANVVFGVSFTNTGRQGYALTAGPSGYDAHLIDGQDQSYVPQTVSDTLATLIAPADGWQPQQSNSGQISFPRPSDLSQLRFVFPNYEALSLELGASGVTASALTSASGGPPLPTAAPSEQEVVLDAIDRVLRQQANAVMSGDSAGYAASFVPEQQALQQQIGGRLAGLPLESYSLRLAPEAQAAQDASDVTLPVDLTYSFQGIGQENLLQYRLAYRFVLGEAGWQAAEVSSDEALPFWWTGDVITRSTPHVLILARPEAQDILPTFGQEAEQAYANLEASGLALEPMYIAYFTATQEDFATLTDRDQRYLGVALSRYVFQGDQVLTNRRVFAINGAAFNDPASFPPGERQRTIQHELVHLALSRDTRPFTPAWLAEGMAVYFSEPVERAELAAQQLPADLTVRQLTTVASLGEHGSSTERTTLEYAFSGAAVAYLIETYGESAVLDFYRSYGQVPSSTFQAAIEADSADGIAETSLQTTEQALQQFFRLDLDQLDAALRGWIAAD